MCRVGFKHLAGPLEPSFTAWPTQDGGVADLLGDRRPLRAPSCPGEGCACAIYSLNIWDLPANCGFLAHPRRQKVLGQCMHSNFQHPFGMR